MPLVVGIFLGLALLALAAGGAALWLLRRRRSLITHAQVLAGWGDFAGAARDLLEAGKWQEAARLLVQAGQRLQAVELYLKHRRVAEALGALSGASIQEIEQAEPCFARRKMLDDPKAQRCLAQLARRAGAYDMAVRLYEHLGEQDAARAAQMQAAEGLAAAGQLLDAAALYAALGEVRLAATARLEAARSAREAKAKCDLARLAAEGFISLGDVQKAAEAYVIAGALDAAADLLVKAGQGARAAELLERGDQWLRAATLYEQLGDLASAARAFRKGGQLHKAAKLLDAAGNSAEAVRCLIELRELMGAGQMLLKGGDLEGALQVFAKLDDKELSRAADLLVEAGHLKRAVQLLVRRNQVRAAADLLKARGEGEWASELLAQLGDRFEKAKVLASRGQCEEAARILLDLGKSDEACAVLRGAPQLGASGRLLLARLALQQEAPEEAIALYSELLESGAAGVDRGEVLYGLSRAFEAASMLFEASAALQELLSFDPNHRDAALRLRLLQGRFTPQPFAAPLSAPASRRITDESQGGAPETCGLPPRYRIVHEIARGSMGVIYRAIDEQLSRPVAIKLLEPKAGNNARIREYFLREARSVARLNHPNIVTVYDAGLQESSPWLVMELVEGDDLRTRFHKGRPSLMQSMRIGSQVASALDCAHACGIVHRDLKPENIMVANDGTAKLADFGIACVMQAGDDGLKRKNTVVGTPVYMAPEQIRGEPIDGRTDIYALGVVLFECFCGRLPFDPDAAMFHHTSTPAPDPLLYRPDLPAELAELVLSCLEKAPERRPQKASYIQRTLVKVGSQMVKAQQRRGAAH